MARIACPSCGEDIEVSEASVCPACLATYRIETEQVGEGPHRTVAVLVAEIEKAPPSERIREVSPGHFHLRGRPRRDGEAQLEAVLLVVVMVTMFAVRVLPAVLLLAAVALVLGWLLAGHYFRFEELAIRDRELLVRRGRAGFGSLHRFPLPEIASFRLQLDAPGTFATIAVARRHADPITLGAGLSLDTRAMQWLRRRLEMDLAAARRAAGAP